MAGRRLRIMHSTGYRYAQVVEASFNEIRMTPISAEGQLLLSHTLDVQPAAPIQSYEDYWGARVEAFDVHVPHRMLEIVAISTVDTPPLPPYRPGGSWDGVRDARRRDELVEYMRPTTYVDDANEDPNREWIVSRMRDEENPEAAARLATFEVRRRLAYAPGATTVSTTAAQAWESGQGVCQDFTHTTLSLLRAAGVPARYVSGYLHTEEPSVGETVVGESHAWVEYWDDGWHAVDPTNDRAVGSAHVIVARGRDYADVPPLKGIYAGGHSEALGVSVEITQL